MDSQTKRNSFSQSTHSATLSTQTDYSESNCENKSWGWLLFRKLKVRYLGVNHVLYQEDETSEKRFDLTGHTFTVGRVTENNLCCSVLGIEKKTLDLLSAHHFKLTKDLSDYNNPVFIEDLSMNGTLINSEPIKLKRRILIHEDVISVGKGRVSFKYQSDRPPNHKLPKEIMMNYHIGRELGEGAFGTVYAVHNIVTCKAFALKFIKKSRPIDSKQVDRAEIEANLMLTLDHPCVLKMHGLIQCIDEGLGLLLDLMDGGDLFSRISYQEFLREENAKFFFYQICMGVQYLHQRKITHRDIKPENILLATKDVNSLIKITDFGLSKENNNHSKLYTQCGTPHYVAPEVVRGEPYTNKVDIFSLGVVLLLALSGFYPENIGGNLTFRENPSNRVTANVKSLLRKMLCINPNQRLSIEQVLRDEWMRDENIIDAAEAVMRNATAVAADRSRSPLLID